MPQIVVPNISGIYAIRNVIDGKVYVGSSVNLRVRWNSHRRDLRLGTHFSTHLQNAWTKYGEGSFEFTILTRCVAEHLPRYEGDFIRDLKACNPEFGYNLDPIVNGSHVLSESHKAKISQANRMRIVTEQTKRRISEAKTGISLSAETRSKMSVAHSGRTFTDEHKQKIQAALQGCERTAETKEKIRTAAKGRMHTEETKQKIGEAATGRQHSEETKDKIRAAQKKRWARAHGEG